MQVKFSVNSVFSFRRAAFMFSVLLLCSCASKPSETTHPYLESLHYLEKSFADAMRENQYRQALELAERAFEGYAMIDDVESMARQRLNQAQIALLVEELPLALRMTESLENLVNSDKLTKSSYRARVILLKANFALLQHDWARALEIIEMTSIDRINDEGLRESLLVAKELAQMKLGITPVFSDFKQPLVLARQLRIRAALALRESDLAKARILLAHAKQIYKQELFPPGIAEVLILESQIASNSEISSQLREQAALIFRKLGNTNAIERHGL